MKLAFIHDRDPQNIGKRLCGPERYFKFEPHEVIEYPVECLWNKTQVDADVYVIGAGNVFAPWAHQHIEAIAKTKGKHVVVWGAGLNYEEPTATSDKYPEWMPRRTLASGVRDYLSCVKWVPCPSCMSPVFDEKYPEPKYEYVIYDHAARKPKVNCAEDTPRSNNLAHRSLASAVEFLASGRVVITSSYYGAYWATLLGRGVVVIPWSTKFYYMRHRPMIGKDDLAGWRLAELIKQVKFYPEALPEARQVNLRFHAHVMEKLSEISE